MDYVVYRLGTYINMASANLFGYYGLFDFVAHLEIYFVRTSDKYK